MAAIARQKHSEPYVLVKAMCSQDFSSVEEEEDKGRCSLDEANSRYTDLK